MQAVYINIFLSSKIFTAIYDHKKKKLFVLLLFYEENITANEKTVSLLTRNKTSPK